jgi:hypothetical protein
VNCIGRCTKADTINLTIIDSIWNLWTQRVHSELTKAHWLVAAVPDNDDNHLRSIPSAPLRRDDPRLQPVSDRGLAIFIAALAAALVIGYLLVNKLADMSREEDCALAHRKNCGEVELSR